MIALIAKWLVIALTVFVLPFFVSGISVDSFFVAVVTAFVLGVFSISVKPIIRLVTLPINLVTLGLFSFIINAVIFWSLTIFVKGFSVNGFIPALIGSLVISLVVVVTGFFLDND